MLKKYRDKTARRPVLAKKGAALPRAAQPVTKQNHGRGRRPGGKINTQRNVALAVRVVNRQVHMRGVERRVHGQGIVTVGLSMDVPGDCQNHQHHPCHPMRHKRRALTHALIFSSGGTRCQAEMLPPSGQGRI